MYKMRDTTGGSRFLVLALGIGIKLLQAQSSCCSSKQPEQAIFTALDPQKCRSMDFMQLRTVDR